FLAWFAVSVSVVVNRALYDLRNRSLLDAQRELEHARLEAAASRDRRTFAAIAYLPRQIVERIAADSLTPQWQAQRFASYILQRWGTSRLVKAASQHRGQNGKWVRVEALRILTLG